MTTTAERRVDAAPATGTVFDIGYQSYSGAREGRGRSRIAVFKDGFRTALGFGRGGRAKILPWLFLALLGFIGLIMALGVIFLLASRFAGLDAGMVRNGAFGWADWLLLALVPAGAAVLAMVLAAAIRFRARE